jgi:LysM repeat protein
MNQQNLKCYIDFVSFAALDCAMFLDTHPKNAEGLEYFEYYTIEKGDNLYRIALKYNINPELLSNLNGLMMDDYIYPGQELLIPKSGYSYYITTEGDTLDIVANRFKVSKNKIMTENETIYLMPDQLLVNKNS